MIFEIIKNKISLEPDFLNLSLSINSYIFERTCDRCGTDF